MSDPTKLNKFDVEREEKKARSLLRSAEGIQALRNVTGYNFVLAGEAKEEKKPIVATLIPSHDGPKPQTVQAFEEMVRFSQPYCIIAPQPSVSSSIVHWVRNELLARLYKSEQPFDYVLFMDDDIVPPPDALVKLLSHQKDIVAGACTVRQDPPLPNFRTYDPKQFAFRTAANWNGEGLLEVGGVGTGLMLISKEALTKVADYYLNCDHEREFFQMPKEQADKVSEGRWEHLKNTHNAWWFECLKHPLGHGEYGEDISFCFKAMRCGIPVFVDTTVKCKHMGSYGYSLDDFYSYRTTVKDVDTVAINPVNASKEKISILVPTRGRPENVKRLSKSIMETAQEVPQVVLYVDDDDNTYDEMIAGLEGLSSMFHFVRGPRITLSQCWNELAKVATGDILMHAGDDIVFKTQGWDVMVKQAFAACPDKILFVHGEDGHWHDKFGTHGFIHRKWMETVGYFVPPYFSSDFNDTWLNEVANALGRRKFLPFVTEHFHPLFGKAEWDKTHLERLERHKADKVDEIYALKADERRADVEKLRAVIEANSCGVKELVTQ